MNDNSVTIHTIGFTQKPAKLFFEKLRASNARRVIDVRLNNVSQLAGFSKKDDLQYFLKEILDVDYIHLPELAPTQNILDAYKKHNGDWSVYEEAFLDLMAKREIEKRLSPEVISGCCFLCSENQPMFCHRRLVAEYLRSHWGSVAIEHLV